MRIIYHDICIRNAENEDCEQLAAWWNDGSVMAHASMFTKAKRSRLELKSAIQIFKKKDWDE